MARPKIFNTPEDMQAAIDKYFNEQDTKALAIGHKLPFYTMSGLALALGVDRKTIINYSKDDRFFHTVREARQKVEQCIEERMVAGEGSATGLIFNAKNNFGWKDAQENLNKNVDINAKNPPTKEEMKEINEVISDEY